MLSIKAALSNFFVITASNNCPYKPIILESHRLSPFHTSIFSLFSKLEIFKVKKIISLWPNKHTNQNVSCECLEKETVWFRFPNNWGYSIACYESIVNKANKMYSSLFLICLIIMTFIYSNVKVVIQPYPSQHQGSILT